MSDPIDRSIDAVIARLRFGDSDGDDHDIAADEIAQLKLDLAQQTANAKTVIELQKEVARLMALMPEHDTRESYRCAECGAFHLRAATDVPQGLPQACPCGAERGALRHADGCTHADAGDVLGLVSKPSRLTAALAKANAQTEHFEREWYLRGDQIEDLQADMRRLRDQFTAEVQRYREALRQIRDDEIIQGMSPALFARLIIQEYSVRQEPGNETPGHQPGCYYGPQVSCVCGLITSRGDQK